MRSSLHPAWHDLMDTAVGAGLTAEPWTRPLGSGAHVRRAAGYLAWTGVEAGHGCPVTMTYAAVPALRHSPDLAAAWEPKLASRTYDFGLRDVTDKDGAIAGMGMTEKQGGSDVRSNETTAARVADGPLAGDTHRLTGHKWFTSAPMSDAFLVLAQTPAGVSCFLVPRVLGDGTRNPFALQRLKDKLGDRSNASSEVEFDGTWGTLVGEEGHGVRTIIDMVGATRLDCVLGSAATMRAALVSAVHHTSHRSAFGRLLVDQPLMRNVLTDLVLESEAASLLGLRLATAVDGGEVDLARIGVAVGKYHVCKRTAPMIAEALECLGGNGYVEEHGLARLYRQAPLNSIWEGSGNVNALDVLRAATREPAAVAALVAELDLARGADATLDRAIDEARASLGSLRPEDAETDARRLVERLAVTLQAALMVRHSPTAIAAAFVRSRLGGEHGMSFGTLPTDVVRSASGDAIARATVS
ncbi:acyl-CoA dehydrogenase family protein [Janibacter sp. G56]|uniref:acyl-CoA dehydrogenase family protein n=1 Tax=Janibacter sp. G56 TaxID=3418717 RepID=UPI003CFC2ADA